MNRQDYIVNKLMDAGFGEYIDLTRREILAHDDEYQNMVKQTNLSEEDYLNLDLDESQKCIINKYIESIQTESFRYADLSYFAGVKDAVALMMSLGLLSTKD